MSRAPFRETWDRALNMRGSFVYFIAGDDLIKIGHTNGNVFQRLFALQLGSPSELDVLVYAPGSRGDEQHLHTRFADFREHREWFRFEGELHDYVWSLINSAEPLMPAPTLWTPQFHGNAGRA